MKVIVDAGAWQLALNALRRDADAGMHVRAEIVEELEKATVSLSDEWQLMPTRETEAMHDAVMSVLYRGVARNRTQTLLDAYISAAPVPSNVRYTPNTVYTYERVCV